MKRGAALLTKTRLRRRRKTRPGQVPEAVLDALWGKRIHQRDEEQCRYLIHLFYDDPPPSPCWGPMQAHHIYTKKYRNLRWDEEDGLLLCARHHMLMHDAPVLAGRFYEELFGRLFLDTLWIKAQAVAKVDRHAVKVHLQSLLEG